MKIQVSVTHNQQVSGLEVYVGGVLCRVSHKEESEPLAPLGNQGSCQRRACMSRRGLAVCLTLLLFLTFLLEPARGTAQTGTAQTENSVLVDLPENSWVQLIPNPSQRYIPRNYTPSDVLEPEPNPMGRSTSGIAYGDGLVYYFGGAHASHPGNDVEIYEIANNIWIQQYKPEVCDVNDTSCNGIYEGWGTDSITPLGRPYVQHTFQQHAYDPVRKRFFAGLISGLWSFDPATSQWTRVTSSIPSSANEIRNWMIHDPELQTVLWAPLGADRYVFSFDFATNAWILRNPIPDALAYNDVMSTYDSGRKRHMVSTTNGTMWWYDAMADAWEQITNVPGEVQGASSLAYDPVNKVVLVAQAGGSPGTPVALWIYDEFGQWTELTPSGPPPMVGSDGFSTRWGTLVYDAGHQAFIFLNVNAGGNGTGGPTETWAYRYRLGPPPPPPSSATISASPTTVNTGGTVTVTVSNGPGNLRDWVGLYLASAPPEDGTWVNLRDWKYLNNTQSPPSTGQTSATLTFTMPSAPGTYHFRFFANDGIALLATSPNVTVTSVPPPPPPPDTEPPTVSMTSPTNGSTVSGTITVSAVASDNVGVVGVQLKLNGLNLGPKLTTPPYVMPWDTTTAPNGAQTLTATARDAAGNRTTSAPVTVTVSNAGVRTGSKLGSLALRPRTTYLFRVRACNAAGCSAPSPAVSATTNPH